MTKADVVDQLLSQTYFCTVCKQEERRLEALPRLRLCLRCASPAQIVEDSDGMMRFIASGTRQSGKAGFVDIRLSDISYIYKALGGPKYSAVLDEFSLTCFKGA
jgi:hypothetical protein